MIPPNRSRPRLVYTTPSSLARSRSAPATAKRKNGGTAKWMKNLLAILLVVPFVLTACAIMLLGVWFVAWAVEAEGYNRTVLAAGSEPSPVAAQVETQPTLVPFQASVSGESFSLVDENQPVAFASNGESFRLVEPTVAPVLTDSSVPVVTPLPSPTPLPRYPTVWISIPSINLSTTVEAVSLKQEVSDGPWFWGTPEKTVGWHEGTGVPGESQAIEFNGHVRWKGKAGIFWRLHKVALEDEIVLTSSDGREYTYLVRQVRIFPASGEEGMNFIRDLENRHEELVILTTCINWSQSKGIYTDRLIVVAVKGETN